MATTDALSAQLGKLGLSSQGTAAPATGSATNKLGQQDFLKLMIAQFRNQDPFKPMDNGQFLGQMAQFGTVSGIDSLQTTVKNLSASLVGNQTLQASALLGKGVLVRAGAAAYSGGTLSGAVQLPDGVTDATVDIRNTSGELVAQVPVHGQGLASFSWDGTTGQGGQAAPGSYSLSASYLQGGSSYDTPVMLSGTVNSVVLNDTSGTKLNVDTLGSVNLSDVQQIQ